MYPKNVHPHTKQEIEEEDVVDEPQEDDVVDEEEDVVEEVLELVDNRLT